MSDEKMTLIDRLNNPAREADGSLNAKSIEADLAMAATIIRVLSTSLKEMNAVYWGSGDGQEPAPSCIINSQTALTLAAA